MLEQRDLRWYKNDPMNRRVETQTQVPWCAGGRAFRFFKAWDLSLKSAGFCCEMSMSALAMMIPKEGKKKSKKDGEKHNFHRLICSIQNVWILQVRL